MGTGQALSTFNQFGFDTMRRHMKASSSGSKSTRKWSPGLAGTAAGTVNRRFESRVTIMVGYSHDRSRVSTWAGEQSRSQIADSKFRFWFAQSLSPSRKTTKERSQMKRPLISRIIGAWFLFLLGFAQAYAQTDPLPSWNDGAAKKAITEFVKTTTEKGSPQFVAPEARIATF